MDGEYSLVDELCADPEGLGHVAQSEGAVGLQQLAVGLDPHLAHIVTVVRRKEPVLLHLLLHHGCDAKTRLEPAEERDVRQKREQRGKGSSPKDWKKTE